VQCVLHISACYTGLWLLYRVVISDGRLYTNTDRETCGKFSNSQVSPSTNSKREAQLMLTNPRDPFRGNSTSPNITIPYARYSFLLRKSNFLFKTRRSSDIRLRKTSWPWNPGQRSLKVIPIETKWYRLIVWYGFLLVFYRNFVPNMHHFFRY